MPACDGDSRGVLPQPPATYITLGSLCTYANAFSLPAEPPTLGLNGTHEMLDEAAAAAGSDASRATTMQRASVRVIIGTISSEAATRLGYWGTDTGRRKCRTRAPWSPLSALRSGCVLQQKR